MGLLQYLFSTSKNPGNILIFINLSRYWKSESFWYFWLTSKYLLYDVTKVCLYNHDLSCRYFFSHKYDIKFILVCIWINFRLNTFDWCNSNTTERKKFAQNNVSFTLKILRRFFPRFVLLRFLDLLLHTTTPQTPWMTWSSRCMSN